MNYHKIPEGGFWKSARPKFSKDTMQIVQGLLMESRMALQKQQWIQRCLDEKHPLPLNLNATDGKRSNAKTAILKNRTAFHKVRTREDIIRSRAYEREPFQPKQDLRNNNKESLQNLMAYGRKEPETSSNPKTETRTAVFSVDTLEHEIEERKQFLKTMQLLGQEKKYRTIINAEISERRRDLQLMKKGKPVPIHHIEIYNKSVI